MTVTTYTSNGTPSDSVGVQGDMNVDYGGRFLWGPKGPTSWAGTAISITGPTGPASTTVAGYGVTCGPAATISTSVTLTSTPTVMYQPNSTSVISTYVAGIGNYFVGALLPSTTGGGTFELYNQTAGASVYKSAAIAANSASVVGQFGASSYPLIAGNTYVWRVTGSSAFTGTVSPFYFGASSGLAPNGGAVSTYQTFQHIGALSSSTASNMAGLGDNVTLNYCSPRAGIIYNVTVSSSSNSTCIAYFYMYNVTASANGYVVTDILGGSTASPISPGQTLTTTYVGSALTAASFYQFRVYGGTAGSGTFTAVMQVAQ